MDVIDDVESADSVISFWLNTVGPEGWYDVNAERDETIRQRFEGTWRAAAEGALDDWTLRPEGSLALLIVLDQFSRNMFRGDARAFSTDARALCVAKKALSLGHDLQTAEPARQFFYLPLMHAECLVDQDRCVRLMLTRMPKTGGKNLPFAREHRDVIRQFGRFPYRNAALGRRTTAAETAYLEGLGQAA